MESFEINLNGLGLEYEYNLSELEIKRNQVIKLSDELDKEKFKNHMLVQQLNSVNNKVKELELNAEVTSRSFKRWERELETFRNNSIKNELIAERMTVEKTTLVTNLQTSQLECIELKRELENLHLKLNLIKMREKKILQEKCQTSSAFENLKRDFEKLENMYEALFAHQTSVTNNLETNTAVTYYQTELTKARNEIRKLELQAIQFKAENDEMKYLMKDKFSEKGSNHYETLNSVEVAYNQIQLEIKKSKQLDKMLLEANEYLKTFLMNENKTNEDLC